MAQDFSDIYSAQAAGVRVEVRINTGARTDRVLGFDTDAAGARRLKVQVRMPPEKGQANAALIALLAKVFGVPKTSMSIVRGETDRNKSILIGGRPDYITAKVVVALEYYDEANEDN